MAKYLVSAKLKYPSAFDTGSEFEIEADTKKEAISEARKTVARECLYDRHDGPLIYTASII